MEISLSQLKKVVHRIEERESDGWEAWIALKNWLAQYEAAQQGVQPTRDSVAEKEPIPTKHPVKIARR